MKKLQVILVVVLALCMLVLTGCDSTTPPSENPSGQESSTESGSNDNKGSTKLTVFEQFEESLDKKNITFQKVTMGAELVGAEQGIKYKLQGENVEIYRFDTSSDAYLEAKRTQSLKMEGFGAFEATVVNGYAIVSDNLELINIFKDIVGKQ